MPHPEGHWEAAISLTGVVFDLDGTLADTGPLSGAAFVHAISHYAGRAVSLAEIEAYWGPNEEGVIRAMVPDRWKACLELYLSFHRECAAAHVRLWPEVGPLIDFSREAGLRLAIGTARGPMSTEIVLDHAGLRPYFDTVVCGSALRAEKPAALRYVRRLWRAGRDETLYVGDMPGDMQSANQAHCRAIGAAWVDTANAAALRDAGAETVFDSIATFRSWLESCRSDHEEGSEREQLVRFR